MNFYQVVTRKKLGEELSGDEIRFVVEGFLSGEIPDYQMSAFLMAVWFRGMTPEETKVLTQIMIESGVSVDLSDIPGPKIDKHSTGGVGDKVSLVLAPLVAACGIKVPMISGRGLGHTGGTLDKLESIPGYRTRLDLDEYRRLLAEVGVVVMGQTGDIAPADGRIYALRDVTATVDSRPLIAASILSKKIAAGPEGIVMDVKTGSGAFMSSPGDALALGELLVHTGHQLGRRVEAVFTNMDRPLGRAVGHALEVKEAVHCLMGKGPEDLTEVTARLGERMLVMGGLAEGPNDARSRLLEALERGEGIEMLRRWVKAQGGELDFEKEGFGLDRTEETREYRSGAGGWLQSIDTWLVGMAAIDLGAGRRVQEDRIDPATGFEILKKPGQKVDAGEPLVRIHARDGAGFDRAMAHLRRAFRIGNSPPIGLASAPLVLGSLDLERGLRSEAPEILPPD